MSEIVTRIAGKSQGRAKRLGIRDGDYIPVTESGCWLWLGAIAVHGYGKISTRYAHRVSYETYRGPIPPGLQIDHLCRVRCCINPDHLEAVTAKENKARGFGPAAVHSRQTHCVNGHMFSDANVWIRKLPNNRESRVCKECRKVGLRRWYRRHHAKNT